MLRVNNLNINFDEFSLSDINFSLSKGEYFMLLGESGTGKSVILECIAGIINQTSGHILLNGKDISNHSIQKRKVGLVFQDYALFPNYNVYDNIAYPLKIRNHSKTKIKERINEHVELFEIKHLLNRSTETLSGGEKQRVALARTLTLNPDILLLDEPLSAIDISLKSELRSLLRKINSKGQTIIHVTHDYEEAISLAHNVAIIHQGKIIQSGSPKDVFQNPKNRFVAHFGGIKNFHKAEIKSNMNNDSKTAIINSDISFTLLTNHKSKLGHVLIGQKNISVSHDKPRNKEHNNFEGIVLEIVPARIGFELVVETSIKFYVSISSKTQSDKNFTVGQRVWITFNASAVRFIPG